MLHVTGDGSAEQHSADPVPTTISRLRLGFRQWRRTRPFWGGLFLFLSGLEYYVSAHMDLAPIKVSFGSQGFLSWLIPLAVLLCGVLTWLSPAQRMFYGIVGAAVAVSGLIGLNLGGFVVGMLLGITGGALAVAWAPVATAPVATAPVEAAEPDEPLAEEGESAEPVHGLDLLDGYEDAGTEDVETAAGRHAAEGDQQQQGEPPTSRLLTLLLLVAAVTAALLALPRPTPAAAAPCPPSPPVSTAPKPPAPSPSASASGSPSPTGGGNPVSNFFDGLGRLLGITHDSTPSPSPSSAPSPAPRAPAAAATGKPVPVPSCPSSPPGKPAPGRARTLAVPPGQPPVNKVPSKQISALLSEIGVSFDGVVDLPVQDGTIRALQFTLSSATSTPFELQVPVVNAGTISLKSSKLTVSGNVRFYASRIKGKALGLLPVDYTPDAPPLLVPPVIFFTDATVDLVFVHADQLTAPNLTIGYR